MYKLIRDDIKDNINSYKTITLYIFFPLYRFENDDLNRRNVIVIIIKMFRSIRNLTVFKRKITKTKSPSQMLIKMLMMKRVLKRKMVMKIVMMIELLIHVKRYFLTRHPIGEECCMWMNFPC